MVTYEIKGPDGKTYEIDGPEGASKQQIVSAIQAKLEAKQAEVRKPEPEPETGFIAGAKAGFQRLLGDIEALKAAGNVEGAEQKAKEYREAAAKIYKQPELLEAPWEYLKGLAGQSVAYMAAPVAAGLAASVAAPATVAGLAATGATFATSALQFSGSNLSRQLEENVSAKDLKVLNAVAASIPQAALDTVSLRMVPGLRNIFAKAGVELGEREAAQLAKESLVVSMAKGVPKTAGVEGLTESAQQVFERAQAGLDLTDAEARKEYFDNFIGGALLGGAIAVPGTVYEKGKAEAEVAAKEAEAERAAITAKEEAAKISQTAVPDATGQVPPPAAPAPLPTFEQRAPGSISTPEPDVDPTIALAEAKAEPTLPRAKKKDETLEEEYLRYNEMLAAGVDSEGKPLAKQYITSITNKLANSKYDEFRKEAVDVTQPAGVDTTGAEPSVISPASGMGTATAGAEASTAAGVVPTGGPATTTSVAEREQPTALKQSEITYGDGATYTGETVDRLPNGQGTYTYPNGDKYVGEFKDGKRHGRGAYTFASGSVTTGIFENDNLISEEPSVAETPEAVETEAQGQKQAAAAQLTDEQLTKLHEEDVATAKEFGANIPSWADLSAKEKEEALPALMERAKTSGMLPAKGEGKKQIPLHLYKLILKDLNKKASEAAKTGEKDSTPKWVVEGYGASREQWEMDNNQIGDTVRWSALSPDERAIFNGAIINGTPGEFKTAFDALHNYRSIKAVSPAKDQKGPETGASYYELNRAAYNREMPEWNNLTPAEKEAFLKEIKPGGDFTRVGQKHQRVVTVEQMDAGFKAATKLINKRLEKQAAEKTKADAEQKAKAQNKAKEEAAIAAEEVEVGKELPPLVKMMLGEGGVNNVLAYIAKKAQGLNFGKMTRNALRARNYGSAALRDLETRHGALTRAIFKNVAASLMRINFSKSTVVVDPNNAIIKQLQREAKLAAYDPKTDTFYFTKDGMDEMTVLHEIVHAGTIKILYAFKTNPESLTSEQRAAAEQINKIYDFAKGKLSEKYPNQMENVYEFVSYALTDPTFQAELAKIQAPSLAKYTNRPHTPTANLQSIWAHLTKAMMKLYGLTKAVARFFEVKPQFYEILTSGGYEREPLLMGGRDAKEVETSVKNYLDGIREKEIIDKETIITFEAVSDLRDRAEAKLKNKYPDVFKDNTDQGVLDFASKCASDKAFAEQVSEAVGFGTTYAQAKIGITKQPGFEGNALLEVTEAFQSILAAPEAGIDLEALPAKQAKPPIAAPAGGSPNVNEIRDTIPSPSFNARSVLKAFDRNKFAEGAVRLLQNDRAAIKNWQRRMWLTGRYMAYGVGFNNIYDQITLSSGNAHWLYTQYINEDNEAVRKAVADYAKTRKLDVDTALKELGMYAIALHEEERRETLYLRTVDLTDTQTLTNTVTGDPISPRAARDAIFAYLDSNKLDLSGAKYLRAQLEKIVNDKDNLGPEAVPRDDQKFAVAGYTSEQIKSMKADYEKHKADADKVLNRLKAVNKATLELNAMANYMSEYANNYIMFYGYENYVPFKGKQFNEDKADIFNHDGRKLGGDFQEDIHTFEGRLTVPDNPILQVMADGAKSAMRAGRKDVTQAIYNAVKEGSLAGEIMKFGKEGETKKDYIDFKDRANDDLLQQLKGETKVFHYMPDGKVAVIQINDKNQREAIRRSYRDTNPMLEFVVNKMNKFTGIAGQMHTRYKLTFAPVNFVRDVLTNAWAIGAEGKGFLGPLQSFRYLSAIALNVVKGDMRKSMNFARLYSKGDIKKIEALAKNDTYYKDLMDYVKTGGRVSYIQGIAPKGQLDELLKTPDGKLFDLDKIKRFFDIWIDTFEMASRTTAFRITKADEVAKLSKKGDLTKDEINEAATKTAAAYAKNLANFEQVGEWGRGLGSMFMFFRPSATGAIRAMDAVAPAFQNRDRVKLSLPEFAQAAQIRQKLQGDVTDTERKKLETKLAELDKALATFDENYKQLQISSRIIMGALAGAGYATYVMAQGSSDDDDLGRNLVSTDDMARWTKFARFHIPGRETPIQIPWGFGLGAFAALGAQLAAMKDGKNPVKLSESLGNMLTITLDSFMPLPFSRIPLSESPGQFALDSITPSIGRPLFEYYMNMDALGHQIYNNRQSKYGDAYTGGDNIPEAYKFAAQRLVEATNGGINWSPNTIYFFFNNYVDGVAALGNSAVNMGLWMSGKKDFNAHTDTMLFDSFFGTRSNFDARQWSRVEKDLKDRAEKVNMFKNNPEQYYEYLAANPFDAMLTKMYNGDANGRLKELREEANKWRTMPGLDIKTRTELVKNAVLQQNLLKYSLIEKYKAFGIEP